MSNLKRIDNASTRYVNASTDNAIVSTRYVNASTDNAIVSTCNAIVSTDNAIVSTDNAIVSTRYVLEIWVIVAASNILLMASLNSV